MSDVRLTCVFNKLMMMMMTMMMMDAFAKHFKEVCAPHSEHRNTELKAVYTEMRSSNVSLMDFVEHESGSVFDVQLLSELVAKMKRGEAAGLDELQCL